ncbi:2-octaprenyl-6-methoxyphenyl hydroxylase [Cellvibrio mixtus]|uniref:2-octaprenyl-6-methoxyphenyl hydroxylase n=1 Tax=Cellvibrio mixtus TaxID=39650 RepID=UPI0005868149|nr:2-octaprenyl-6-methoxyphenyl hydroxylase [Cellvibrio mixtus]
MSEILEFDIAIIGGGMVGTSLASMLAASQPQLRIALIEAQPFARADEAHYQSSFDARSTALSYGTAKIMQELGLWGKLRQRITPIAQVHVSDRGHFLGGLIDAAANNLDAVGYVVENAWLGNVLLAKVQSLESIHCFAPAKVLELIPQENSARLRVQMNAQEFLIDAALAVVADGGDSAVRRDLGIATHIREYGQTAIITNVEFSGAHQGIAFERFTDQGPIALLPLGESVHAQKSALVWTLPADQADAMLLASDADFLAHLQTRFGFRVGKFTCVAKRFAYPLQLVLAQEQVRSHVVLLGNAAHFLHPVAGQGFNLALRDCACLVETLGDAVAQGHAPGDLSVLQTYLETQALDQQLTIEFSDKLVRLFSNNQLPLIALRHLGLLSLESLPLIKDQFIAQTMGTAGRQYRWLRDSVVGSAEENHPTVLTAKASVLNATEFDVIIVGAGLVGASLACAIAQTDAAQQLRIAVIEAGGDAQHFSREYFDPRVVALTHASEKLLRSIGCWDAIARERVCAYREMKVWDGEGTAAIEFDCAEVQRTHLGHIVENSVIVNQLRVRMAQLSNITLVQPATVIELIPAADKNSSMSVKLNSGITLMSSLIIAADGAQSRVRELAGFKTREWDYGQQAIITTVRTEKPHEFTAWQRFMNTGPLAFLPLQNNGDAHQCSIVWSAEDDVAQTLMALDNETFCARLTEAFEARLGNVLACDKRYAIPLRQRHAVHYIQQNIALVGDAAHNIHPLAGQGVNLGLLDVIALAEEIERALTRGIPLTDESILRRYQRQRLAGNLGMMSAMEAFKQLFGSRSLGINWLRNTGMRQLNSIPAVKKFIVNTALGVN